MSSRDPLYGKTPEGELPASDAWAATDQDRWDQESGSTFDQAHDAGTVSEKAGQAKEQVSKAADDVLHQASQKADQASGKASEVADRAQQAADQGMDQAASGLDMAAGTLRQQGEERGGTVGNVATMAADRLEGASGYLRDKDTSQLVDDLEALVRRKPTESLLVAAGIGFVLSKVFR